MPSRTEEIEKDKLFSKVPKGDNYLGNTETIKNLLDYHLSVWLDEVDGVSEKKAVAATEDRAKELASIFLGKKSDTFYPIPRWNETGGIDEFLADQVGIDETDPEVRMRHSFLKFFDEALDIAKLASDETLFDEQWEWKIGALVHRWTNLLIGLSDSEIDSMILEETDG